jgi:hypothetical protein
LHTVVPDPSVTDSVVAAPPVICQANVADAPGTIVLGEAVKFRVNGTVTVTLFAEEVPPGPLAVIWYVVVLLIGTSVEPEVGSGPVSSG